MIIKTLTKPTFIKLSSEYMFQMMFILKDLNRCDHLKDSVNCVDLLFISTMRPIFFFGFNSSGTLSPNFWYIISFEYLLK